MNLLHKLAFLGAFVSYLLVWTLGWSWVLDPDVHIVLITKASIWYKLCDLLAYFLSLKNILLYPEEEAAILVFVCGQMVHVVLQSRQELASVTYDNKEKTSTPIMPKAKFPATSYDGIRKPRIDNCRAVGGGRFTHGTAREWSSLSTPLFSGLAFRSFNYNGAAAKRDRIQTQRWHFQPSPNYERERRNPAWPGRGIHFHLRAHAWRHPPHADWIHGGEELEPVPQAAEPAARDGRGGRRGGGALPVARGGGGGSAGLDRAAAGAPGPGAQRRVDLSGWTGRKMPRWSASSCPPQNGPQPTQVPGQQSSWVCQEIHRVQGLMSCVT